MSLLKSPTTMKLENIILPGKDPKSRWTVIIHSDNNNNTIKSIDPTRTTKSPDQSESEPASILLPTLCHPHIHLDKAYILTCNVQHNPRFSSAESDGIKDGGGVPDYTDLAPQSGSFSEALTKTSEAKRRYALEDLYLRGSQLLGTSLTQGVTSCRAFVELDHVTQTSCLETAISLQTAFADQIKVQICAFAQDPIFSTEYGSENRRILESALDGDRRNKHIGALGTTPYVETSKEASIQNVEWAIEMAMKYSLNLDFHLDYNLDPNQPAMVWEVIRLLKEARWEERSNPNRTISLGHCTRLTLFTREEMSKLAEEIRTSKLPIHFVGLPTSDLFMMGRPSDEVEARADRPRGTLQVLDMIKDGIDACLSVNNVGNAFTPWGTGDPLSLASMGVGMYQSGTEDDAARLYECVSTRARRAIGLTDEDGRGGGEHEFGLDKQGLVLDAGCKGPFLLINNEEWVGCPGHLSMKIPARQRVSVRDVVWDPPEVKLRKIVR